MATIDITNQSLGGTGDALARGTLNVGQYVVEVDLGRAAADDSDYVAGDTLRVKAMDLPAGTILLAVDAEISEALPASSTTNIGTTAGDPDEYVDAQTDTAVGRFTGYVAGATATAVIAADAVLYVQVANAGAISTGKIKVTVVAASPVEEIPGVSVYRSDLPNPPASTAG